MLRDVTITAEPPKTISHFVIDERLGSGGSGEVFRASDIRLGRRVAIKFLRPEAVGDRSMRQRFIDEARAASSVDHPNICTIFEVDETPDGAVFIVMAYYDGETLDRYIARGPLDVHRALSVAIQLGRGLAAAHEELLIHRDVKPANVMIARGGTVKILDFGLARLFDRRAGAALMEGTPAYMSPEQLRGDGVDLRTDVWASGVVLYEMLTGTRPFRCESIEGAVDSVTHDTPPALSHVRPELPARLDRIIDRALAKDPRLRYERVEPMLADLQAVQADIADSVTTARRAAAESHSSIAVLPFDDMSEAKDQEYLCDGIAEEVLRALTGIPGLYVASRTSAFQFKRRGGDIREIGAKLNVDTVLEGSVRRSGDRVRVSSQLVNVSDGYRLWYERFDRDFRDIFSIEDEIADRIAQALRVTLDRKTAQREGSLSSDDAEAYQLYLQGRYFFHQHRRKTFEIALQTFSRAIDIAPNYARAYAGIADCNSFLNLYFGQKESAMAADAASARALALDDRLAEAHSSRGLALFTQSRLDEAEQQLRRAIELAPRVYEPHYIFGRIAFSRGAISDAAAHFREACAINPDAYDAWYLLGMCYRRVGDAERAHSAALECIEAAKKVARLHPDDTRALTMGAAVLAEVGEPERACAWVERALAVDADEPIIEYNSACVYIALHRFDDAISCLERAESAGISRGWLENDPDLDPLRGDPRFQALVTKV